ncbi:hypothetical protein D3C71_1186770 [compost metagenome]
MNFEKVLFLRRFRLDGGVNAQGVQYVERFEEGGHSVGEPAVRVAFEVFQALRRPGLEVLRQLGKRFIQCDDCLCMSLGGGEVGFQKVVHALGAFDVIDVVLQLNQRLALFGNEAGQVKGRQSVDPQFMMHQDRAVLVGGFLLVVEAAVNVLELAIGLDQVATGLDQLVDDDLISFLQYLEVQPVA